MATIKSIATLVIDGDWIESKDQSPNGIRLIQTGNVGIGEYLDKSNRAKYISEETLQRLNCTELMVGDILISRLPDPIGRACIVPNSVGRAITAVDCTIIRLDPTKCNAEYFVQYTQSELYQARLSQFFAGSTRTRISRKNLEQIEISLPNIEEQKKVASTLGNVDALISIRKQQLAKLDELVKARFVELFGDPITNSKNLPTERMELRFNLKAGITTAAENIHDFEEGKFEVPCYGGNGIRGYVEKQSYSGNYPIIGRQGALCGNVQYATGEFHATEHAVLVSLLKDDNTVWVYHLLKLMDLFRFHTGAAQPGLAVKTLNTVDVLIADRELQNQFAAFVEQTDKSKLAIQQSLDKLETLKKSLMQKYFG